MSEDEGPVIAVFDYPDVFEDFYTHYGVDQKSFGTTWAETGAHRFATSLDRRVGNVVWYAFSLEPEVPFYQHEATGMRIRFLRSSFLHRKLWRWFYASPRSWQRMKWRRAYETLAPYIALMSLDLIKALWRDRPDAFFIQDYANGRFDVLILISRLMRIPALAFHSGSLPENFSGVIVRRWSLRHADALLVSSRREATMIETRFSVAAERIRVLFTPIDTASFYPLRREEALRETGLDPSRRYVIFVGRLEKVKRVESLLQAFSCCAQLHADVDLLIVGEGSRGEELRARGSELPAGRVRFLGWRSGSAVLAPLYSASECLVLPSLREGFPTVVGEALACGLPVLATDVGGIAEVVTHGVNGWLIPGLDDDALRIHLEKVLSGNLDLASFRIQARKTAEDMLSLEKIGAALKDSFRSAGLHVRP
ncbi:MAG: glycosyltransferase [Actinomycetota bacterium]